MTRIITLLNEKGGVGKTTLATHIAAGLAHRGQRVVLVDADAQGHSTVRCGLPKQPGFYDLLVRDANFEQVLRPVEPVRYMTPGETPRGQFFIVPGNVETRLVSEALGDNLWIFQERFTELDGLIDAVVVDTSPTPSLLHGLIYMATDHILYPSELEDLSLDGLAESIRHRSKADKRREMQGLDNIRIMGIQPTMYRKCNVHDYHLQLLLENFKRLTWPSIPLRKTWAETGTANKMLFAYAPSSAATVEAWALVERVEKGLVG